METNYLHSDITGLIIKVFYKVYNTLGSGFLEKIYENALLIELNKSGLKSESQKQIDVFYEGQNIGTYFADIVVNDVVIIELKAVESIAKIHEAQLVNYLRATGIEVGLLLNFGKEPQHKKRVLTNDYKKKIRHLIIGILRNWLRHLKFNLSNILNNLNNPKKSVSKTKI